MKRLLLHFLVLVLVAVGCSSEPDETTTAGVTGEPVPEGDTVVFVWSETGGCAMAGPNCARYEVAADGMVNTYREGENVVANTGSIDVQLVTDWIDISSGTDIGVLKAQLGAGEMTAAFDGVDFTLRAPEAGIEISSVEFEFANGEPLFDAARNLVTEAAAAAPLALKQR